jgi:hypothetical protein
VNKRQRKHSGTPYDLDFCSDYGYPDCIQQQLTRILEEIFYRNTTDIESILVVGSTARGELSYTFEEKRLYLFSDYEFLLITQQKVPPDHKNLLSHRMNQLSYQLNPNTPLFHIDLGWCSLPHLPNLAHTVAIFEQKETGKVIFGTDCRSLMPNITAESLDRKNANEILYKRLWALLLYLPQEFYRSISKKRADTIATYVLVRNALDLTTVLLPHEGILLPTYTQRVEYLETNFPHMRLRTAFSSDLPQFLIDCLESRNNLIWNGSLQTLYSQVITYLKEALDYLLAEQGCSTNNIVNTIQTQSQLIFHEDLPMRSRIRTALRILWGRQSVHRAAKWINLSRKGILTASLLQMHRAMIANLDGKVSEAYTLLEQARSLLDSLSSQPVPKLDTHQPFITQWLLIRRSLGYFWWEFVRQRNPACYDRIRTLTELQ